MMDNFENPQHNKEQQERFGRNVDLTIKLIRHGHKDEKGSLSEEGRKKAREWSKNLESENIKSYVSDVDRVKDTAKEIIEASKAEDKFQMREEEPLKASAFITGDPDDSDFIEKVDKRTSEAMKVPKEDREEALEKAESKNVREWLSYENESPDEEVASPKGVAKGLAQRIRTYVDMSDRLKSGSEVELLNVTHEFMVAAFVKYFLKKESEGESMKGEDILETLNYRIDPLEGLSINVKTDRKGEKSIGAEINGEEYEVDMDEVRKFS